MSDRSRHRFFLSVYFFLSGVCFSTWASRIPSIKTQFGYSDAELGTVLLAMPLSSLAGLPLSSWLVSRYDSRVPALYSFISLALGLLLIGLAPTTLTLVLAVCLFSFSLRIANIAVNTQSVSVQRLFDRKITGTLHGLWSTGGIVGVGICTWLVAWNVSMGVHLAMVALLVIAVAAYSYPHLLAGDRATSGNKFKLGRPDPYIVYLGLIVFFALVCEGGMFDWSGVFFREVVGEDLFTLGYLIFMVCMAVSRFTSDWLMEQLGMPRTFVLSALLVMAGIGLAVGWPFFWPCIIGFCFVGVGTAAVIPMVFLLAGQSKKYAPGIVISIISTYGIAGMLLAPPLIGYLAQAIGLRYAFIAFGLAGMVVIPLSHLFFRYRQQEAGR
ncbi:MAG: MFS transporter [Cyclobacteriaceae bacterium]|jgi:MFS family permease|nr:MFS transporter [Cyclobacteriaceae bacterium]